MACGSAKSASRGGSFTLPAYLAAPLNRRNAPVGRVISEILGVHEDIADVARRSSFVVFPEAPHAFHADYRPGYRKAAADEGWAWRRTGSRPKAWLDRAAKVVNRPLARCRRSGAAWPLKKSP